MTYSKVNNATIGNVSEFTFIRCNCLSDIEVTTERMAFLVFGFGVAFATIITNLSFIISVVPHQKLRSNVNMLLVSNAIADTCVGIFVIPTQMTMWLVKECWPFDHIGCLYYYASKEYLIAVSVIHMMAIAVERYCRLLHSNSRVHKICFENQLLWTITACWIYPSLTSYFRITLPYFVKWYPYSQDPAMANETCNIYRQQPCNCVTCFTSASFIVEAALQYFAPILIMVFLYSRIMFIAFWRLRISRKLRGRIDSEAANRTSTYSTQITGPKKLTFLHSIRSGSGLNLFRTKEYRSIRMFLIIVIAFLLPWGPHAVNRLMSAFGYSTMDSDFMDDAQQAGDLSSASYSTAPYRTFRSTVNLLGYCNSLVNPLLLFLLCRNFRVGFRMTFMRCVYKQRDGEIESNHSRWNHYARAVMKAS